MSIGIAGSENPNQKWELQNTNCKMQNAERRMQNTECRIQKSWGRLSPSIKQKGINLHAKCKTNAKKIQRKCREMQNKKKKKKKKRGLGLIMDEI